MTHNQPSSSDLAFTDPVFKKNPYPLYAQLRNQQPVHRVSLPDGRGIWVVTGYEEVLTVLKDTRHFVKNARMVASDEQKQQFAHLPALLMPLFNNLLAVDPPDHTRLRVLVQKAFTPRFLETLTPRVQAIADELLDRVQDKHEIELINQYAFPLPITVIVNMLGIPPEDDRLFREWSTMFVSINGGHFDLTFMERIVPTMQAFTDYMHHIFELKRQHPMDDLISGLVKAEAEGDKLNDNELLAMIIILLVAGHETTMNLIGNGVVALLKHPDQLERLRKEPDLMGLAIEEMLRYDSSVESTFSYVGEDVVLGNQHLKRGETVLAILSSANRDSRQFPNANQFDITRAENRHLAFGQGVHYCLGAPLARMEAQIALKTLLERMPDLRLKVDVDALQYRSSMHFRGFETIPLLF